MVCYDIALRNLMMSYVLFSREHFVVLSKVVIATPFYWATVSPVVGICEKNWIVPTFVKFCSIEASSASSCMYYRHGSKESTDRLLCIVPHSVAVDTVGWLVKLGCIKYFVSICYECYLSTYCSDRNVTVPLSICTSVLQFQLFIIVKNNECCFLCFNSVNVTTYN